MHHSIPDSPSIIRGEIKGFVPSPELYALLREQIQRYTMDDSSSVPAETAAEILRSIHFTVSHAKHDEDESSPIHALFDEGRKELKRLTAETNALFKEIKRSPPREMGAAYHETIHEIGLFFARYDFYFAAHDIPCMINYPLLLPIRNKQGIDFIREFLTRLYVENTILSRFPASNRGMLYRAYVSDYEEQIINFLEPVLINAIGRLILKENPLFLDIPDSGLLHNMLIKLDEPELDRVLKDKTKELMAALSLQDSAMHAYIQEAILELKPRILVGEGFEGIFIAFDRRPEK